MLSGLKLGNQLCFLAKLSGLKILYAIFKGIPKVGVGGLGYNNLRTFDPLPTLPSVFALTFKSLPDVLISKTLAIYNIGM